MILTCALLLLQTGTWSSIPPIPTARQEVAVAAVEGRVYVIGGYDSQGRASDVVEFFDTRTNTWLPAPRVPLPMHHPMAAAVGTKVYVAGGYTEPLGAFRNTFELDTDTLTWTRKADMPTPRGAGAAVAHNGKVYVLGGERAGTTVAEVSVFDPATNAWTDLAPMPTPRNHFGAGVIRGRIYAVGGRPGNIAVNEAYDPLTNVWTTKAPMPTARSGIGVAATGNYLFAFGGEGNAASPIGIFLENEAYNPDLDSWAMLGPMALPRHGIGGAVVGNRIFLPAGATVQGFGTTAQSDVFAVNEDLLLPQFVVGGGYSTDIVVTNPDPVRIAEVTVSLPNTTETLTVPPLASRTIAASDPSTTLRIGTVRIRANARLSAYALIRGAGPQLTVYPANPSRNVIFDVRRIRAGGVSTGVSLLNTSTEPATVTLGFRDRTTGEEGLRVERTLAGGEQLARFIHELFADLQNVDFAGTVTVRSSRQLAVAALAFDPTGIVTIPVVPIE